ncbi:MAG: TRAP transporter large permease [Geminicoccaceae bacterium]|nr:TRAP transporter large permease [Geminicoccaceae bacterium]
MSAAFLIFLATFLAMAAIGLPVAFAKIVGSVVYLSITGQDVGLIAETMLNGLFDGFVLLAVPLFILAASFMNAGAITDRLLRFSLALVGRFKGGLGHVNIVASLIFSGMSGSAIADAAGIGRVIIDMMRREDRYPAGFAAAVTAASATIGPIIPPSIPMVLYALVADTSIGYLFLAGIFPGLVMGAALMAMNAWIAHRRGFTQDEIVPLAELPGVTLRAFPALMLPVILLGGIYGGATTPTEAASVAALYALFLAVIVYRRLDLKSFAQLVLDAARSSAVVGLIIAGALVFNYIVASENIPGRVADALEGLDMSATQFLLFANLLFLALGCLFDATTMLLIVVPILLPTCRALGVDLVHFGVVITVNIMIGLITPPYGVLLFVINGITGIALRDIIREIWPFLLALLVALFSMTLVPAIVLWLPRMFGYQG